MFKNQDRILLEERIGHNIGSSILDGSEHLSRSDKELELQLNQLLDKSRRARVGDDRGPAARRIQDLEPIID